MKNYNLTFLPLFEEDLNQIVDYISLQLKNPKAALQLADQVYTAIQERLPCARARKTVCRHQSGHLNARGDSGAFVQVLTWNGCLFP